MPNFVLLYIMYIFILLSGGFLNMKKKVLSIILALIMVAGTVPFGAIPAFAESGSERIAFMYYDESTNALRKGFFNGNYTEIENTTTSWNTGWYVAEGEVTIDTRVTVTGDVKLILKDGCKLTVIGGIRLADSNKLTVLGQPAGTGELNLTCNGTDKGSNAGIGGNIHESAGILTVHGGTVNAESGYAAGIGGGAGGGNGGTVTVYAGTVRASSGGIPQALAAVQVPGTEAMDRQKAARSRFTAVPLKQAVVMNAASEEPTAALPLSR